MNINTICTILAQELTLISSQYTDGLVCGKEFINKVGEELLKACDALPTSTCQIRIPHCKEVECPCVKELGTHDHEKQERDYVKFLTKHL